MTIHALFYMAGLVIAFRWGYVMGKNKLTRELTEILDSRLQADSDYNKISPKESGEYHHWTKPENP